MGTTTIRRLLDAGRGPVVVYTAIAEEMLLAACLAARARGAVTKTAPGATVTDVLRVVSTGGMCVDPATAGALRRYAGTPVRRYAGTPVRRATSCRSAKSTAGQRAAYRAKG